MIDLPVTLTPSGGVVLPGHASALALGYTKNRGVYRLSVTASGEWEGLTIRAFWHVPGGSDPASSLVVDGLVGVPSSVTAQPGTGCITFEGSDGTRTVTSADLRYRVAANSGTEDGSLPEPGTPAWQELVDAVHTDATAAEQAKTDAQTAASEAATSAGNAAQSAQEAADSLQELKDGIAAGDFKGEKGDTGPQGPKGDVGPAGADGKDGIQIDDTTVGTDAWSSKHIVDMLCPPLDETGNPVVCYPVVGYPWGVKAEWEPMQDGSGTPSPENIRPIKGRDSVTVERCGENLLKLAEEMPESDCDKDGSNNTKRIIKPGTCVYGLTANNYLYASQVSNVIFFEGGVSFHALSTGYGIGIGVHLVPGARYKIFYVAKGDESHSVSFYDFTGTHINFTSEKNFEVPANAAYACVVFRASSSVNVDLKFENVAIVLDGGAESYAPYTGQTATLTLPSTIYSGTVDAVTGDGQETWKPVTLDGTENWEAQQTSIPGKFGFTLEMPGIATPEGPGIKGDIVCNQYPAVTANDTYRCKNGISVEAQKNYHFRIYNDTHAGETADEWKSYLAAQYAAGTPVQIAYKMATPEPFTATGAQPIPALSGVNTVMTDADALTVTGRADPIKRITDLEDAVASMTNT